TLNQEPDALPFPLDAFPEPLQRFCLGAAIVTSAAPDITGVSMLATASAAIGQSVNLYLKRTHQESPLLYVLTVADPGRSKTPAIKLVTRPLIQSTRSSGTSHNSKNKPGRKPRKWSANKPKA